jgi:hypothetical protein
MTFGDLHRLKAFGVNRHPLPARPAGKDINDSLRDVKGQQIAQSPRNFLYCLSFARILVFFFRSRLLCTRWVVCYLSLPTSLLLWDALNHPDALHHLPRYDATLPSPATLSHTYSECLCFGYAYPAATLSVCIRLTCAILTPGYLYLIGRSHTGLLYPHHITFSYDTQVWRETMVKSLICSAQAHSAGKSLAQ